MKNKIIVAHSIIHWRGHDPEFVACFSSKQDFDIFNKAWKNDPNKNQRFLTIQEVSLDPIYENNPPSYEPPYPIQDQ